MKKVIALSATLGATLVPLFSVLAQPVVTNISSAVIFIKGLLNIAIGLLVALAVFYVIWGVFEFVQSAGDEEKRKEGRGRMIYGVIGIAVMLSVYGLVNILTGSVVLPTKTLDIPMIPLVI